MALVLAVVIPGCGPRPPSAPLATPASAPSNNMTEPDEESPLTSGAVVSHALIPAEELRAWIESKATTDNKRARFVLPVVVVVGGLGIDSAFIGSSINASSDEHLAIRLDDSALGIPLTGRLRSLCPGVNRCALWLEGHWGPLLSGGPAVGGSDAPPTFAVLTVGEPLPVDAPSKELDAIRVRLAD